MATAPLSNLTATWNASGTTFTGLKLDVTDTASAAGSLLMDLQVGGASKFSVTKDGKLTAQTLTVGLGGQTSVANNTALGYQALNSASLTGTHTVGVGYQALLANTTGAENTAVGSAALSNNLTGTLNVALGRNALLYYDTSQNTAVGAAAIRGSSTVANNTGAYLTGVGRQSLLNNTSGVNNSALGFQSLISNTTGSYNTGVGYLASQSNTTGSNNCAFGNVASPFNTTGSNNVAVGHAALYSYNTSNNTAVGYEAAKGSATVGDNTGDNLTAVGHQALVNNTSGGSNTSLGVAAGDVITTGARNTIIGKGSDPSAASGNDQTVVGEGLTGKGDDTAFIGGTNGAYNEKNVTTWETTSDARIKKNIADFSDGLSVIEALRVCTFEYRAPEEITELPQSAAIDRPGVQLGVIAQEIREVLPACVTENSTGVLSVSTDPLVWHLVNAVKQLSAEIKVLKGHADV